MVCLGTELALRGYRVLLVDLANMFDVLAPNFTDRA